MKKNGIQVQEHHDAEKVPKGIVVLSHGYREHMGRYGSFVKSLQENGWSVYAYDLRGHGDSDGFRGHVSTFEHYIDDLHSVVKEALEANPEKPIVLFGHSLGGLITMRYILSPKSQDIRKSIKACILSAPFTKKREPVSPIDRMLIPIIERLHPKYSTKEKGDFSRALTRDQVEVDKRNEDRKCFDHATVRWFAEAVRAQAYVSKHAQEIQVPTHTFIPGSDAVVLASHTKEVVEKIPKSTIYEYPDCFHELLFDMDREKVTTQIIEILNGV